MIYLISSCTNSKKNTAHPTLKISNLSTKWPLHRAIDQWLENITNSNPEVTALDLYKGASWQSTLETYRLLSSHIETKLFVASAGYGLIKAEKKITSYDSTFAANTENSISRFHNTSSDHSNTVWWDAINKITINDFSKDSTFFIILPYEYLLATQNFIKSLIEKFENKVLIFTANQKSVPCFMNPYLIQFDTRFNTFQKGTASSLLQRAVQWVSKEIIEKNIPLTRDAIQKHIDKTLSKHEKFEMPKREKIDESSIREKIVKMIESGQVNSASQGLRLFRQNGFACEQKRFGKLFREIKSELS